MRSLADDNLLSFVLLASLLLIRRTHAIGVSFTSPGAGASWPAGPIKVTWTDAGGSPDMSALTTYVLQLVVGGNSPFDSSVIATLGAHNAHVADGGVEGVIAADIAKSVENGFYFKMTSNTSDDNHVENYSPRFTLINMNGTTDSKYLDGANSAAGSSDVPEAVYNVINSGSSPPSSTAPATTTATATATATATSTPNPDDGALSTGTKIAVSVGTMFAVIGLVSLFGWAYIIYRHRKRKEQRQKQRPLSGGPRASKFGKSAFLGGKAELPASHSTASSQTTLPLELRPTHEPHEVPGTWGMDKAVEAARASIYELEGEWSGWEAGSGRKSKAYDPTAM